MPKMLANRADLSAGQKVLVHVRCNVAGKVRREKLNGRDVVIVPSATMPDDIVMNEIAYPADEIEKSFASLDRTPAPLGHPLVNGRFVSARDPEGINIGWIGAFNTNVRRENGRVLIDKVIDVERANQTEGGKRVLNAIEKGEPIHTSTGLLCELEAANGDVNYKFIARNMEFDHDAILLDEEGAATPDQGVGIFVNSAGKADEIEVVNSAIEEADRDLDWALDSAFRALEKRRRAPLIERMKAAILEAFGSERETSTNMKEIDMPVSDEQFKSLSDEVKTLSESMKGLSETVTNAVIEAVKPIKEHVDEIKANQQAETEAKRTEAINTLTKTGQWEEDELKDMPLSALNKLVEKAKPGKAAALNGAFRGGGEDQSFKLPAGDKKEA